MDRTVSQFLVLPSGDPGGLSQEETAKSDEEIRVTAAGSVSARRHSEIFGIPGHLGNPPKLGVTRLGIPIRSHR